MTFFSDFCNDLEDLIYSFKCTDPMIIVGDLNMNLGSCKINCNFKNFIDNNKLVNNNWYITTQPILNFIM